MPEALSSAIPVIIPALATITSVWATIQGIKKIRREAINRGIPAGLKWAPVPLAFGLMAVAFGTLTIAAVINAA